MGNGNAYLIDALTRKDVHITAVRHEAATVASADAYYRIRRELAVATTTYGPGFTNAITALAEAAQSRTPLVLIVGEAPTSGMRPWDIDQISLASSVGVKTVSVSQDNAAAATDRAVQLALHERIPVVLAIPYDLAQAESTEQEMNIVEHNASDDSQIIRSQIDGIIARIKESKKPLILAGRGAREAQQALHALASGIGALTVSTAPAQGTFAGRQYDLGVCGGFASTSSAKLIKEADLVLVFGASLNQFTSSFGHAFNPQAHIVQIDIQSRATSSQVSEFVRSDASKFANALNGRIDSNDAAPWSGAAEAARNSSTHLQRDPGTELARDGRLDPRSVMTKINEILPFNKQVVSDGGHFIGWANTYLDITRPDGITLVGTAFQSIGLGMPSAAGAARACPDDTIVVVSGDGGGIMGIPDLDTLVRTARSSVVLIFNDAGYGAEVHQYGSQGLSEAIMHIDEIDFVSIANGVGARGIVVEKLTDLKVLEDWISEGAVGSILVDLRISQTIRAPYIQEIIDLTLKK